MSDKLLYRVEEAAEMLGIGRTAVFRLIAQGSLSSVLIGSSRRIPARALTEYVERLCRLEGEAS